MPLGAPREPLGPLGGPRLRLCMGGGGPRLPPLSNWDFVACSTLIGLPSRDLPFISRAASFASAGLSNVTKAKPLDLLVSRSFIKRTSTILPYLLKYCSRAFSLVSVLRPPMNSFPGLSASAIVHRYNVEQRPFQNECIHLFSAELGLFCAISNRH